MRLTVYLAPILLSVCLSACASLSEVPGAQTVGAAPDPDHNKKLAVVAATFTVDAVAIYGALPPCNKAIKQPLGCRNEKSYQDAKLIAKLVAQDYSNPTAAVLGIGLTLAQWQLSKTVRGAPGPTDPTAPPDEATVQYLNALNMSALLISTGDARVEEAVSVNTNLADLVAALNQKVAALP